MKRLKLKAQFAVFIPSSFNMSPIIWLILKLACASSQTSAPSARRSGTEPIWHIRTLRSREEQEQDNVSESARVKTATPISHLAADHEMFNYCLLTLALTDLPPRASVWGSGWGAARRRRRGGRGWWRRWEEQKPVIPRSLSFSLCSLFLRLLQSRSGITNDIMTIFHALQTSDVLPTHLLWYLVTDPAVNQGRVMGLEARRLLGLANDLEGNRGCQCLQHVLHWQSSRAPSKTLSYKLCRSLRFYQMSKHWCWLFFLCPYTSFMDFPSRVCGSGWREANLCPQGESCSGGSWVEGCR